MLSLYALQFVSNDTGSGVPLSRLLVLLLLPVGAVSVAAHDIVALVCRRERVGNVIEDAEIFEVPNPEPMPPPRPDDPDPSPPS